MPKRILIKCIECGEWRNIKVMHGEKRKKICERCLHPEKFREVFE